MIVAVNIVGDSILAAGFGLAMTLAGVLHFRRSRKLANPSSRQVAEHPWQRLWFPARWYSTDKLFFQARATAVGMIVMGSFIFIACIVVLLVHQ